MWTTVHQCGKVCMPSPQPFLSTKHVHKFSTKMDSGGEVIKFVHMCCGEVFHSKNK